MLQPTTKLFDPRRHITAGTLRGLGFLLCENIPDGAFVRRIAVGLSTRDNLTDNSCRSLSLDVIEPFMLQHEEALLAVA